MHRYYHLQFKPDTRLVPTECYREAAVRNYINRNVATR